MDNEQRVNFVKGEISKRSENEQADIIKSTTKTNGGGGSQREGSSDGDTTQPSCPYRVEDGCIVMEKQTNNGPVTKPLCNFAATVTEEIILDDGVETTRTFLIDGQLQGGRALPTARVPSSQFSSMGWVTKEWGLPAIVHPGQANKDYLRAAIQTLSTNARSRQVFQHTGWREIDGE